MDAGGIGGANLKLGGGSMGKFNIEIEISVAKVANWVAGKIGIQRAAFPSVEAAKGAIEEFLKEHNLYGVAPFTLAQKAPGALTLEITGQGKDFERTCQLLEKEFGLQPSN
jgi:hypothetical protein